MTNLPMTLSALPRISGGLTPDSVILGALPARLIKIGMGQIYHVSGFNTGPGVICVHWYDIGTLPIPGVGVPFWRSIIPQDYSGVIEHVPEGVPFLLGLAYTATALITDSDATPIAPNVAALNVGYA